MAETIHIATESAEQDIIRLAHSYPHIRHDFDDCGTMHPLANHIEAALVTVDNPTINLAQRHYLDAFLTLHTNKKRQDYAPFFSTINDFLDKEHIGVRKGDTTFMNGTPYGILFLTLPDSRHPGRRLITDSEDLIGTCDAVVEGRHFRPEQSLYHSGFYAACAAVSDIGANGGMPALLRVLLINPPDMPDTFLDGIYEACALGGITDCKSLPYIKDTSLGEFTAAFAVLGTVKKGHQLTLRGLEKDMHISIAGSAGISSALDYHIPLLHLQNNVSSAFRKNIFDSIGGKGLCSDVSDGVLKSVKNLLRHATGLDILLSEEALLKTSCNPFHANVTLKDILHGGDDYCLVLATHDHLHLDHVTPVGKVIPGTGKILFKD